MSACPSVLFNIDSVVKASWRKPQAGWTQEEKNTAEAVRLAAGARSSPSWATSDRRW